MAAANTTINSANNSTESLLPDLASDQRDLIRKLNAEDGELLEELTESGLLTEKLNFTEDLFFSTLEHDTRELFDVCGLGDTDLNLDELTLFDENVTDDSSEKR